MGQLFQFLKDIKGNFFQFRSEIESMEITCPSCRRTVEPGLFGVRLECKHWVHAKCLDLKNPDFVNCAACKGEVNLNIPQFDKNEVDSISGRDYIKQPLSDSYFTSFSRAIYQKKEPFKWLADKTPLEWIIKEKGYGLQKLIQSGVRFDDFMHGGYTWQELKAFKDFGDPERLQRAKEALVALKCNAEHFRDYPHLIGDVLKELNVTGRNLVEIFGLYFQEKSCKPLMVAGGYNNKPWTANHLVNLGFKMKDLYGAGLEYLEQYALLNPTDQDEIAMEVQDSDIADLPSLTELERQKKEAEEKLRRVNSSVEPEATQTRRIYIELPKIEIKPRPQLHGLRK